MPEIGEQRLNAVHLLQLLVLISAVPLQYWLTKTSSETSRQYELTRFMHSLSDFRSKYLNVTVWQTWCGDLLHALDDPDFFSSSSSGKSDESPPKEVLKQTSLVGNFGSSLDVRTHRPPTISYRIGQVVKHKENGYKGVIVGWDETAKAPDVWLKKMHPADRPDLRLQPNYAILIDTRDRLTPQLAYLAEESIETITAQRILHPLLEHYFEGWDGAMYLARPWLKKVYPHDQ